MTEFSRDADAAAIDWLIRQRDTAFDDWQGFEDWLAADPVHARAFADAAATMADLDAALPLVEMPTFPETAPGSHTNVVPLPRPTRRYWIGGAMAAALALAVGLGSWTHAPARDLYTIGTAPGERREIALAGAHLTLNGDTVIRLDRNDARYAMLDRGQAMFAIQHDAAHPFTVKSGTRTLVDAGTAFEVTRDGADLDVAVSEGLVVVDPDRSAVKVPAGSRGSARDGADIAVSGIAPAEVASWRGGQLAYDDATLARVASDLHRALGITVTAAPAVAAHNFQGVIRLDGGAEPTMARLGVLLGVPVRRVGQGWTIG